jgi:hypothetical protein
MEGSIYFFFVRFWALFMSPFFGFVGVVAVSFFSLS